MFCRPAFDERRDPKFVILLHLLEKFEILIRSLHAFKELCSIISVVMAVSNDARGFVFQIQKLLAARTGLH